MQMPVWLARWLPGRHRGGHRGGALRRFDAAQYTRLTHSWVSAERSINTELRCDLDALRRRARDLSKNSPLGRKFLQMVTNNVAGPKASTCRRASRTPTASRTRWPITPSRPPGKTGAARAIATSPSA